VPMIGCHCPTCSSRNPKDKRTNASLLIERQGANILIDCGRDFRIQALREDIQRVDHLFLTHTHFDHIAGIDDLRVFNHSQSAPIPVYGKEEHLSYLKEHIYHYLFDKGQQRGGGVARLELLALGGPIKVQGLLFEPLPVFHGQQQIYGYRFGGCAYISDVSSIPDETLERLKDLEILIVDALRFRSHPTHFNLEQALEVVNRLKPSRTYLTHMCHDILHDEVERGLQDPSSGYYNAHSVHLAYDGLSLSVE
jgi:phosphoribosyl 1,2-cyclic phosphate phosphodiesterase